MNLHFITSISRDYWYITGKKCISTWDLPGKVTIFVEQRSGDLSWTNELPFPWQLVYAPDLELGRLTAKTKVSKFWGKSCAQMYAVRERDTDERVIWLDADIEQTNPVPPEVFNYLFDEPLAMLNSGDNEDCWESGVVIFNQRFEKLNLIMNKYEHAWTNEEILSSLWKPYDAQVLGYVATQRGYKNLCHTPCSNVNALKNSYLAEYFIHWINKENKAKLNEQD